MSGSPMPLKEASVNQTDLHDLAKLFHLSFLIVLIIHQMYTTAWLCCRKEFISEVYAWKLLDTFLVLSKCPPSLLSLPVL